MATCPNGHDNPEGQHFCGECGAQLTTAVKPRTKPNEVQPGDSVRVVAPGDEHDGKIGTIDQISDDGKIWVRFGHFWNLMTYLMTYDFGRDELKPFKKRKRKVWPWVLLGVFVLFFGGCTVLVLIGGVSEKSKPVLDKNGTYYHVNAGTDGTYETHGSNRSPNANGVIRPCTWTRLRAPDLTIENTIEMGKVEANETGRVTLESGEYFVFYGCHPWHYVG